MPPPSILSESTKRAILESIENPEIDSFGFTNLCRIQPNVFGLSKSEQRKKVTVFRRDRINDRKSHPLLYVNWCIRLNVEVNEADIGIYSLYKARKIAADSISQLEPRTHKIYSPDKNNMTPTRPKRSPLRFDDLLDDIHNVDDEDDDDFDSNKDKSGKSSDC
jgi:DNA-directed RNA polymerase delta subunit